MFQKITLKNVTPNTRSQTTIAKGDYRFTFGVESTIASGKGTLAGTVAVGPVCPTPNPDGFSCTPTAEMYAAAKVFVYLTDKKTLIQTIIPDAQGKFSISLTTGTYYIDMAKQSMGGTYGVPTTVTISSGKTATLSLRVDTGLR